MKRKEINSGMSDLLWYFFFRFGVNKGRTDIRELINLTEVLREAYLNRSSPLLLAVCNHFSKNRSIPIRFDNTLKKNVAETKYQIGKPHTSL